MALQGTLETFSVPEVLRLLSSTRKTGMLALDGDRGKGTVWMGDGSIISARSDHEDTGDIEATLFDLLRFSTGDFVFKADATPDHEVSVEVDVDSALERAEELLAEWRELESVVPSLLVGVHLARELNRESVTVTAEQWSALAAIGGGTSAAGLGQRLELGELDTCRRIRDLVDASLIELTDEIPEVVPADPSHDALDAQADREEGRYYDEPELVEHDLSTDEVASLGMNLAGFVAQPTEPDVATDDHAEPVVEEPVVEEPVFDDPVDEPAMNGHAPVAAEDEELDPAMELAADFDGVAVEPAVVSDDVESADEFLAQLTNLSPKAAAAVEATAEESSARAEASDEEPPRSDPVQEGDEEINRNLLLKFLSSTKN